MGWLEETTATPSDRPKTRHIKVQQASKTLEFWTFGAYLSDGVVQKMEVLPTIHWQLQ